MKKTVTIQIILFFFIIFISLFVYLKYFNQNDPSKNIEINPSKLDDNSENNLIKKIEYESTDNKGRSYIIKSDTGLIDEKNPEIIFMKNVNAKITLKNLNTIYISALEAKYNIVTYETLFKKNVKLNFLDHKLKSDNLDLLFNDNVITAYNNLLYKNLNLSMNADKIEIDMLTKNAKIFNYDEKKVKIKSLN